MEPTINIPAQAVCHRILTGDPSCYPHAEYQGQAIYFCTEYCQRAFLEDPQRFLPAHGKVSGAPSRYEFNPGETN